MKARNNIVILALLGLAPICGMNAQAQVSDPFSEYPNGSTISAGLNGGTGWSGAWAGNGANGTVNSGVLDQSAGAAGGNPAFWRYFATPVSIATGLTYYFRGDIALDSPSGWWGDTITSGSGQQIAELVVNNNFLTSQVGGSTFSGGTTGYTQGATEEIVGELQFSSSSTLTLSVWASPGAGSLPGTQSAAGSPIWTQSGSFSAANIGGVLLQGFSLPTSGTGATAQNLFFGSTWGSVTTVPEPGVLALTALAGLVFLRRVCRSQP